MPHHRVLVLVLGTILAYAPSALAEEKDPLEPLAWLVGGKWVADIKSADGSPLAVETTFEWAGHKKAIKYAITFATGGKTITQYEGTYWYHPGKKQVILLQIDRLGNVTESTLTFEEKGFRQVNVLSAMDGSKREQRVELAREGDDTFKFRALVPKDGQWVEGVAFTYKRVRSVK